MFDWNDLKYLVAIARHGSTIAAAKALNVNQSTVHRRLSELERRLGQPLITRHSTGYKLTAFGEALLPSAEGVESAVGAVERQVGAHLRQLHGVIRLTCPEPLVSRISESALLALFRERYPALRVEFVMSDRYLDLAKGEADIALRSGEPDDENLVGCRIGDSIWAVYASRGYVQRHGKPEQIQDLADHAIIGFDGSLSGHRAAKWLEKIAPNAEVAARNNSILGVLHAAKSGIGIAPLPTTIADMHEDLVQILPPVEDLARGWYLLANPQLRRTPAIAAFFDFVVQRRELLRPVLMG